MKTNQNQAVQSAAQLPSVKVRKSQIVVSSLQIAKDFGKHHKNVLRDIKNLDCSLYFQELNFEPSSYNSMLPNNGRKKLPMYYITRDGFAFLAMGFTGKIASKFRENYINAFNAMEKSLQEIKLNGFVLIKIFNEQKKQTEYWRLESDRILDLLVSSSRIMERMAEAMCRE